MHKNLDELIRQAQSIILAEAEAVKAFAGQLDNSLLDIIQWLLKCNGHVLVTGAGTSHAVAQRFAHLLSCSGTPALCMNAGDALHGGSGAITADDVVYVISKGGSSDEVNNLVKIARSRGAKVIAQTENAISPLARMSDGVFLVKAPNDVDPYGMVATGSSLVNCAAGDVLCALLMELRGYTKAAFAETHPGGAVGLKIKLTQEENNGSV
ncbi:MAG: SIS domain-containing protein [Anaerolineae bacterium]|nr:SIS domain-containing protein [Anaerolineae bacterium]